MDSNELIDRLKRRDLDAVSELYNKYAAAFLGMILRIVRTRDKAEIILEQAFIKINNDIHSIKNTTGLFGPACRIVSSMAVQSMSASGRMETSNPEPDTEVSASNKVCMELLADIESPTKEIIDYLYFQGHSLEETCDAFNIQIDKIKPILKSAFDHFRSKLNSTQSNSTLAYGS